MSTPGPVVPGLEPLARFVVRLAEPLEIGDTPTGRKRVIGIVGGTFSGSRLRGDVLAGGADWQTVGADGRAVIDTRYTLRTDDGALLSVATAGVRHGPPAVLAAIAAGEPVDPADYYFRVSVRIETGAAAYDWLSRHVIVASAVRTRDAVVYDAYLLT